MSEPYIAQPGETIAIYSKVSGEVGAKACEIVTLLEISQNHILFSSETPLCHAMGVEHCAQLKFPKEGLYRLEYSESQSPLPPHIYSAKIDTSIAYSIPTEEPSESANEPTPDQEKIV